MGPILIFPFIVTVLYLGVLKYLKNGYKIKSFIFIYWDFIICWNSPIWQIGSVPPGLNVDEVSEAYNANSLLKPAGSLWNVYANYFQIICSYQPRFILT